MNVQMTDTIKLRLQKETDITTQNRYNSNDPTISDMLLMTQLSLNKASG